MYNKFIEIEELNTFKNQTQWQDWIISNYSIIGFKKRDVIVKAIALLLSKYYYLDAISFKLPKIEIEEVITSTSNYISDSNRYATRIYNAIDTIKKSKYCKPEGGGSNRKDTFLQFKLNYLNLSKTSFTLLPEALFTFFLFDRKYESAFSLYNGDHRLSSLRSTNSEKPPIGRICNPEISLQEVILSDNNKKEIFNFINSIKNRDKLLLWGVNYLPKLLLAGTIGSGKSITAEAIAKELGYRLYRVSSEDIVGEFLGQTAKNIVKAFDFAYRNRDNLIMFIDEIEGLIGMRLNTSAASKEMGRAVNTFLTLIEEMSELLLISASNHSHLIDKSALSRFTKKIWYDLPDKRMIKKIFQIHLKKIPRSKDLNLDLLLQDATELELSGRDIRNLVVELCQEMLSLNKDDLDNNTLFTCYKRMKDNNDFQEKSREYSTYLRE